MKTASKLYLCKPSSIAYSDALDKYAAYGVNAELALEQLKRCSVSIQCWQGDDVQGFESNKSELGGGLAVTGAYPGRARTSDELREDAAKAFSLIPGKHRFALHASYGDFGGGKVERNSVSPEHFSIWVDWAKALGVGLDFNPTYFSHPMASSGFTLSHLDPGVRRFWIEHGQRCREIGCHFGRELGSACITNFWIPDGWKDQPASRSAPRERLLDSLDAIFKKRLSEKFNVDSVEGKLFGLGSESYVTGSHEFYLGYAITRKKWVCIDTGHYHPTEVVADKLSAIKPWVPGVLLHISRGIRWDSDHVVTLTDSLIDLAQEVVRGGEMESGKVRIGLDYFDASINRVAAWVIGTRSVLKSLLVALLEPRARLEQMESEGDLTGRLAFQESIRGLPWPVLWDHYCETQGVPSEYDWLKHVIDYERSVLNKRS